MLGVERMITVFSGCYVDCREGAGAPGRVAVNFIVIVRVSVMIIARVMVMIIARVMVMIRVTIRVGFRV